MATAEIDAGVCGHKALVTATRGEGYRVKVTIESDCPHVQKISDDLDEVDAVQQIGLRNGLPSALQAAYVRCAHAACPVPAGIVKAIEVAAGLALPADVSMRISKE